MTNTFPPGAVELSSATSAFSEMDGDDLCEAWEVLMLRPIESLLLLQLGCMMQCHLSDQPLSLLPTVCSSHLTVSVCVTPALLLLVASLVSFSFSPLCQLSLHIFPFHLVMCPYLCLTLHGSPYLLVIDLDTLA